MLGCGPSNVSKKEAIDFAEQFLKDAVVECEFLNPNYAQDVLDGGRMILDRYQHLLPKEKLDNLKRLGILK